MFGRRILSFFKISPRAKLVSSANPTDESKYKSLGHKAVSIIMFTVTGTIALSALDDLVIYNDCSRRAMEKAANNKVIAVLIGEPIVSGPWYGASIAVANLRRSTSCSFPISGPKGNGIINLKAIHIEDKGWLSYLRRDGWEIMTLDALLHIPSNDEKKKILRIDLLQDVPTSYKRPPAPLDSRSSDQQ